MLSNLSYLVTFYTATEAMYCRHHSGRKEMRQDLFQTSLGLLLEPVKGLHNKVQSLHRHTLPSMLALATTATTHLPHRAGSPDHCPDTPSLLCWLSLPQQQQTFPTVLALPTTAVPHSGQTHTLFAAINIYTT